MLLRSPNTGFGRGSPTSPTGVPAWLAGLAVNSWVEIEGSAMSNFPPSVVQTGYSGNGPPAKIDAWCGLAIDTRTNTIWSLANGGHLDYFGNEVDTLCLNVDSPVWTERLAASLGWTNPNDSARYSDGRPASAHSYYRQHVIEARNRAMRFGCGAVSTSGNPHNEMEGYDVTATTGTNGFDAAATFPTVPGATASALATSKDPTTEDVYVFNTNVDVRKWTQATNSWSQVNVGYPPVDCTESATAFDSSRSRIFVLKGANSDCHHTYDIASGTFTSQTLTGSGAATVAATGKALGMIYEPTLDAYLVRLGAAGASVFSINASTFVVTDLAPTGGSSLPATVTISGSPENVYSRFLYAPSLGGVVYFPQYAANAWFLRTH